LGPHFAASHSTAERFANGDLYGDYQSPGQVVGAKLHVRNAVRFENEEALELHALWVCRQANLLDEEAIWRHWGADKADEMEAFMEALEPLPDWQKLQTLWAMLPDGMEPWELLRTEDMSGVYLASAVRTDLRRRGYDGLLYENSLESEGDPDECAVVFDEDQIEIIEIEALAVDEEMADLK
jgi:hypothetical protein